MFMKSVPTCKKAGASPLCWLPPLHQVISTLEKSGVQQVDHALHSGFFACSGILLDNSLAGGTVDLLDHVHQSGFGSGLVFSLSGNNNLFGSGSNAAFGLFVPDSAFFALILPLFGGCFFCSQSFLHTKRTGSSRTAAKLPRGSCVPLSVTVFAGRSMITVAVPLQLTKAG